MIKIKIKERTHAERKCSAREITKEENRLHHGQTLVYDIPPPTSAIVDYAVGLKKILYKITRLVLFELFATNLLLVEPQQKTAR